MSEKVQVWRDSSQNVYESYRREAGYASRYYCINEGFPGLQVHFGGLVSGYTFETTGTCHQQYPYEGRGDHEGSYEYTPIKTFLNGDFVNGLLVKEFWGRDCFENWDNPYEPDCTERTESLQQYSAKDLLQHIDDEVRTANGLSGSDPINEVYSTENFVLRYHPDFGNISGVRIRKDTEALQANGTPFKIIGANQWIWFSWDNGNRGNSYKSHVSAIADSDSANGELNFVPPLYGGSNYGVMYVHTGEDQPQEQFDWKELHISTMPKDDM
ncbi:hypothetical protein P4475_09985 [Halalkalibacterium halodurans]|uniref:hypothetical protein n=1 Tax=Halalkalibacterium halodurans TaxID=86665 RepID=UPI002E215F58|nr:hypothetical protein [Halalkalibacterium halodurans]